MNHSVVPTSELEPAVSILRLLSFRGDDARIRLEVAVALSELVQGVRLPTVTWVMSMLEQCANYAGCNERPGASRLLYRAADALLDVLSDYNDEDEDDG
jgi:hypothetical protein